MTSVFNKKEEFQGSFTDFYMSKMSIKKCTFDEVETLTVRNSTVKKEDLQRMVVVKHLVFELCTLESLEPLLNGATETLELNRCSVPSSEHGQSLMRLKSLMVRGPPFANVQYLKLRVALPLDHLVYTYELSDDYPDVLSKVTTTIELEEPPCDKTCEQIRAPSLLIRGGIRQITLSPFVKRLFVRGSWVRSTIQYPYVETLYIDFDTFDTAQFPNLVELYGGFYSNRPYAFPLGKLEEQLPRLKLLSCENRSPFSEIQRDGLKCVFVGMHGLQNLLHNTPKRAE